MDPLTLMAHTPETLRKVVFFGHFGPAALAFARSCRDSGIHTYLLTPVANQAPNSLDAADAPVFAGIASIDGSLDGTADGIRDIVQYVSDVGAQAITAQSDSHCLWLARNASQFGGACRVLAAHVSCLELLKCKERQIELATAAGFEVLPTGVVRTIADVDRIDPAMYPVCLRPASPEAVKPSFRALKADTPNELTEHVRKLDSLTGALLAQPFRVLPNLIVHCARHEASGAIFAMDAFLVDRKFEGFALRMKRISLPRGMEAKIQAFSCLANLSGVYHFDFLHNPQTGVSYFLEVNARFGGTTDKVARMGVDEPLNCLSAYGLISEGQEATSGRHCNSVVNKRAVLKHLVLMLYGNPEPWDFPLESRGKGALRSMGDLVLTRDSVFSWRDLRGSLRFHLRRPVRIRGRSISGFAAIGNTISAAAYDHAPVAQTYRT